MTHHQLTYVQIFSVYKCEGQISETENCICFVARQFCHITCNHATPCNFQAAKCRQFWSIVHALCRGVGIHGSMGQLSPKFCLIRNKGQSHIKCGSFITGPLKLNTFRRPCDMSPWFIISLHTRASMRNSALWQLCDAMMSWFGRWAELVIY